MAIWIQSLGVFYALEDRAASLTPHLPLFRNAPAKSREAAELDGRSLDEIKQYLLEQ